MGLRELLRLLCLHLHKSTWIIISVLKKRPQEWCVWRDGVVCTSHIYYHNLALQARSTSSTHTAICTDNASADGFRLTHTVAAAHLLPPSPLKEFNLSRMSHCLLNPKPSKPAVVTPALTGHGLPLWPWCHWSALSCLFNFGQLVSFLDSLRIFPESFKGLLLYWTGSSCLFFFFFLTWSMRPHPGESL